MYEALETDTTKLFTAFVDEETAAWARYGVERDGRFLVQHSENINAPISCHLHNPTFYTADPFSQRTYDTTNVSIKQLILAGLTRQNCLFYDHIARRDRSMDGFVYYPRPIIDLNERHMLHIRQCMNSVVEICWGKPVEERMKKLITLVPLRLWGEFEKIELFLEISSDGKPVRFVIFVKHPQRFFHATQWTLEGRRFRETEGRDQDRRLSIAAKLAGIRIEEHFYETTHRVGTYGRLNQQQMKVYHKLEAAAIRELQKAVPHKFKRKRTPLGSDGPETDGNTGFKEASTQEDEVEKVADRGAMHQLETPTAEWAKYFIRSKDECKGLPGMVTIKCQRCKKETYKDNDPQWTKEPSPRYVERRPNCKTCDNKNCTWKPTDERIVSMTAANMSKKWRKFKENEIEATSVKPEVFFSRSFTTTKLKQVSGQSLETIKGKHGVQRDKRREKRREQLFIDNN